VGGAPSGSNLALAKMEFEYCIDIDSALSPAAACVAGENYKLGLFAVPAPKHGGALPPAQSFVRLEEECGAVSISSFASRPVTDGRGEKTKAYVLRLCELSGKAASGKATLPYGVKAAYYTNLRGNYIRDAKTSGGAVEYEVGAFGVASIAIETENKNR